MSSKFIFLLIQSATGTRTDHLSSTPFKTLTWAVTARSM